MKKLLAALCFLCVLFGSVALVVQQPVQANELSLEEIEKELKDTNHLLELSVNATKPLESEVTALEARINAARAGIAQARKETNQLASSIEDREAELGVYYSLLSERVKTQYKQLRIASPLQVVFSSADATGVTKALEYQSSLRERNQELIAVVGEDIAQLESDKKKLEERQATLDRLQKELDKQAAFLKGEIAKAKDYQKDLTNKIAELSAKQQAIINARSGGYATAVGNVPLADDFNASIGFKSQAPSNSFAVFSFGAYTHRNGMSQWGAKARADAGQSAEEILRAYYPGATLKKDYNVMSTIRVQGHGEMPFEDQYLQGIYEMYESWPLEVQKAQAIAARTYAIRRTSNGSDDICTTESCQVFKNEIKGGKWQQAVNETKGWVLVDGSGAPVSTQYALSHGGYTNNMGWDTTDGSHGSDWTTKAWESKANTPWFYKAWYRDGYSKTGANCGKNHPWMSEEEMADIINAWTVSKDPQGADTSRILPTTINTCAIPGISGDNPYSMQEMKEYASKSRGAVTDISSVTTYSKDGTTTNVVFQTNIGKVSIPGTEFKEIFAVRAPGYLRIPQKGFAHFNVEHKK